MNEMNVRVNIKEISKRYLVLQKEAAKTDTHVIPVIKNNANGLGFAGTYWILRNFGISRMATSYACEWLKNKAISEDRGVEKVSWIWHPDPKYLEVSNLILVCKTFKQLSFCLVNNIKFYCEFVLDQDGMYRGGFTSADIEELKTMGITKINFQTHNPHEDPERLKLFYKSLYEMIDKIKAAGIEIDEVSVENSYAFWHAEERYHGGFARLGETFLLPKEDYNPITWETYVAAVSHIPAGQYAGYDMVKIDKPTTVAILPVGYYHLEVENLKHVKIQLNDYSMKKFDTICSMHDTTLVDITGYEDKINLDTLVVLNDNELFLENYNRCIQKTWKLNPDMVEPNYVFE